MSCSSCTKHALQVFLKGFDARIPPNTCTGSAFATARAGAIRPLHNKSSSRSPSTQPYAFQTEFDDARIPSLGDRTGLQPLGSEISLIERDVKPSGIGPAGQQMKDLQEQVSSISPESEEKPNSKNASQKKSQSTPARLARRERRMPSRRFQGDRTRPEMKETASSKAVSRKREKTPRWAKNASGSPEKESTAEKTTSKLKKPGHEDEQPKPPIELWGIQKRALKEKFAEQGWMPRKRLSPDALEGIRTLHSQHSETYTTPVLAEHFKVSSEAIRRILKSKWRPNDEEEEERKRRWEKRGENIWSQMTELGVKPPKKWREKGIGRLAEREGRGRGRSTLEEEIGTDSDRGVITTRVAEDRGKHRSLATKIL